MLRCLQGQQKTGEAARQGGGGTCGGRGLAESPQVEWREKDRSRLEFKISMLQKLINLRSLEAEGGRCRVSMIPSAT